MSDYQPLMQELYLSHKLLKKEFDDWQRPKTRKAKKEELNFEPKSVSAARDKFWAALNKLWDLKLSPLQVKFAEDPINAVDEVIEFLAIDIPAFRCGYVKEFFLSRLKSIELKPLQISELQQLALDLCQNPRYRREFGDWARLMIKIADRSLIDTLNDLSKVQQDENVQKAAKWMRNKIIENRKDLRSFAD